MAIELELSIVAIRDRGIPNAERIAIKANLDCDMGNFVMGVGFRGEGESIVPINDNLFWFGNGFVKAGDMVFLYTGHGTPQSDQVPNQDNRFHTVFWRKKHVLFSTREIQPFLLRSGGVSLAPDSHPSSSLVGTQRLAPQL